MNKLQTISCRSALGKTISLIDTISVLCTELYKKRKYLENKDVQEAIRDMQHNETAYYSISKLAFTEQDKENRKMIDVAVQGIIKSGEAKKILQNLNLTNNE